MSHRMEDTHGGRAAALNGWRETDDNAEKEYVSISSLMLTAGQKVEYCVLSRHGKQITLVLHTNCCTIKSLVAGK